MVRYLVTWNDSSILAWLADELGSPLISELSPDLCELLALPAKQAEPLFCLALAERLQDTEQAVQRQGKKIECIANWAPHLLARSPRLLYGTICA